MMVVEEEKEDLVMVSNFEAFWQFPNGNEYGSRSAQPYLPHSTHIKDAIENVWYAHTLAHCIAIARSRMLNQTYHTDSVTLTRYLCSSKVVKLDSSFDVSLYISQVS